MNPLIFIYTRLVSLTAFGLRLVILLAVCAGVFGSCHLSGWWDLHYRQAASPPVDRFLALAARNPLVHFEDAILDERSFWARTQTAAKQPLVAPRLSSASSPPWQVVWQWLSAESLLTHNPYPQLRRARLQTSWQLGQLLLFYYVSTQLAALSLGMLALGVWAGIRMCFAWPRRRLPPNAHRLTDHELQAAPITLTVPTASCFALALPPALLQLAAQSPTAKQLLEILAAHPDWPASLDHHGAQPGGLLAHTIRAVELALSHPGASDEKLRRACLLSVLGHDVGKVLAYAPRPDGRYGSRSFYHANKSADLLMQAGIGHELPPDMTEAVITAVRASAAKSLLPIPDNAPAETQTLLTWLTEIDRQAVSRDVADLKAVVAQADIPGLLPVLFAAPAPSPDLPPPLYRDGGSPCVIRESARAVLVSVLDLDDHPGVHATTGRRDPIWDALKASLQERGAAATETKIELMGRARPFAALVVPETLLVPSPAELKTG